MTHDSHDRTFDLRDGRTATVTDDFLLVSDDPDVRVNYDDVSEIVAEDLDWFQTALGVALVGFGLFSLTRSIFGVAFVLIGVGSLYLTYRRRDRIVVRVSGRPKPLTLYPTETEAFYRAVGDAAGT